MNHRISSTMDRTQVQELDAKLQPGPRAAAEARALLRKHLSLQEDDLKDLELLVTEIVTNAVRHAGMSPKDRVGLRMAGEAGGVQIEITDAGRGFSDDHAPPSMEDKPTPRPGLSGGFGLYLLDRLAADWCIEQNPTRVRFLFRSQE